MPDDAPETQPDLADYQSAIDSMETIMDVSAEDAMTLARRARQIAAQRKIENRLLADIMSSPVQSVGPGTPLADAAHLLVTRRISGLPVVDDERLVGIITEADFLRTLGVPSHQPNHSVWQTLESLFEHLSHHGELHGPDDRVAEHMQRKVVCARPDDHVDEALALMKRHRVKRLVVCDDQQRPVGIVTRSNLVRIFFDSFRPRDKHPSSPPQATR